MMPNEYLKVLADLDKQMQIAGTQKRKRQIEMARKHLNAVYEAEKPEPRSKRKKPIPSADMERFLKDVRQRCMLSALEQKRSQPTDDYDRGRQAGMLEAFDQVYDLISAKIRGEA